MMKYIMRISIIISIACFSLNPSLYAESLITLFLRPYPDLVPSNENAHRTCEKCAQPNYASKQQIKSLIDQNLVSGIYATYAGFITSSSHDGQISFPRKHEAPIIYIIATSRIAPVNMNSTTIAYWELEKKFPASMYKIERKKDQSTGVFFWNVTQEPLPKDNKVPLNSILIFAKPESIYVPTGITITKDSPNLHLPDIYVKPEINKLSNALYVLYLRHFFGPVKNALKKEKKQYAIQVTY